MPVSLETVRKVRGLEISYGWLKVNSEGVPTSVLRPTRIRGNETVRTRVMDDFHQASGEPEEVMFVSRWVSPLKAEDAMFRRKELYRFEEEDFFKKHMPTICQQLYGLVTREGMMNIRHAIDEGLEDLHRFPPAVIEDRSGFLARSERQGVIYNVNGQALNS